MRECRTAKARDAWPCCENIVSRSQTSSLPLPPPPPPVRGHALYLSVNVFSTKVLFGDSIFTPPAGEGTPILRGHPSHAKVSPLTVQREYLHFSVISRPLVLVPPRESNPRPPALRLSALSTELSLPRL